jgi:hypothetical protein
MASVMPTTTFVKKFQKTISENIRPLRKNLELSMNVIMKMKTEQVKPA